VLPPGNLIAPVDYIFVPEARALTSGAARMFGSRLSTRLSGNGRMKQYIFVTGGVLSLGKGSPRLHRACSGPAASRRSDPYISIDSGRSDPIQHGGSLRHGRRAETDLDLGHYDASRTRASAATTTSRPGDLLLGHHQETLRLHLGRTVQIIPHITDEIMADFRKVPEVDVVIVEIGGTVGDIESLPFLEAMRQFMWEVGPENAIAIHLTLVPHLGKAGELKTKPTQHSVKMLREIGIQPNIIFCRADRYLSPEIKAKIALFCNVTPDAVVTGKDVETIYEVPLALHEEDRREDRRLLNIWTSAPTFRSGRRSSGGSSRGGGRIAWW
jgi:CTP synthase